MSVTEQKDYLLKGSESPSGMQAACILGYWN